MNLNLDEGSSVSVINNRKFKSFLNIKICGQQKFIK